MSKIYTSADQLIGKTPLLELTHIENKHGLKAKVLVKLEYYFYYYDYYFPSFIPIPKTNSLNIGSVSHQLQNSCHSDNL